MAEACAFNITGTSAGQVGPEVEGHDLQKPSGGKHRRVSRPLCSEEMLIGREKPQADEVGIIGAEDGTTSKLQGDQEQTLGMASRMQLSGGASDPSGEVDALTESQKHASFRVDNGMESDVSLPPAVSASEEEVPIIPSEAFVVHTTRAIDPLVGELFVCPHTLEAFCLHRILGLPITFAWESLPSPSPSRDVTPSPSQPWWPLAGKGTPLPAAVNPKTGRVLSGRRLLETLRKSCAPSQLRGNALEGAPHSIEAPTRVSGRTNSRQNDSGRDGPEHPLSIGTYDARHPAEVERATQFATTELVQQAVQAALVSSVPSSSYTISSACWCWSSVCVKAVE